MFYDFLSTAFLMPKTTSDLFTITKDVFYPDLSASDLYHLLGSLGLCKLRVGIPCAYFPEPELKLIKEVGIKVTKATL